MSQLDKILSKAERQKKYSDDDKRDFKDKKGEWPRCQANGCVLNSSAQQSLCTYHHGADPTDWPRITESIKKNIVYVNKVTELTKAPPGYWKGAVIQQMKTWDLLPMQEGEPPSMYLYRFTRFTLNKVKEYELQD